VDKIHCLRKQKKGRRKKVTRWDAAPPASIAAGCFSALSCEASRRTFLGGILRKVG
jgi:hypothetical protein